MLIYIYELHIAILYCIVRPNIHGIIKPCKILHLIIIKSQHRTIPWYAQKNTCSVESLVIYCSIPVFPLSWKKQHFWRPANKNFENWHLQNLDAISFTGGTFTKHNFGVFSKMCWSYFHNLSHFQVTARIYSSEHWKNVQTHFGLCIPKTKVFAVNLDTFCKFWPCKINNKSSWNIFMIKRPKTAVCCRVQMNFGRFRPARFAEIILSKPSQFMSQKPSCLLRSSDKFGSSPLARFKEKVLGTFSWFMCPKAKVLAVKFRRILEVLTCKVHRNVLGTFSQFMRPKSKIFAVKFWRIFQVLWLQDLEKKFWVHFHALIVQ